MTNEERLVLLKTRRQHAAWCAARDEWREQSGILRSRAGSEGVPRSPLSRRCRVRHDAQGARQAAHALAACTARGMSGCGA